MNGTGLYVKTEGQGEPLIQLHGGPEMDHSYFTPHFDELKDRYRLIYFDQRGAGRSSADLDEEKMKYTLSTFAFHNCHIAEQYV